MQIMNYDKKEIQKQWDKDPCGAFSVQDKEIGTLEFYRAIRNYRYNIYAPWLEKEICFFEWKQKDILEIGVGLGSDHFRFANNNNRMTALDLSIVHLKHTYQHLEMEGLTTSLLVGDAERIPFESECFDLVYSFGVLHHTPDIETAIREVYRVLRSKGTAIISLYHKNSYFFIFWVIVKGLIKGGIWIKGWRRLLSEIEYRVDPDSAEPLVKVYSRKQAKKLFSYFSNVEISVAHIDPGRFRSILPIPRRVLEKFFKWFGWYLIIKAEK